MKEAIIFVIALVLILLVWTAFQQDQINKLEDRVQRLAELQLQGINATYSNDSAIIERINQIQNQLK